MTNDKAAEVACAYNALSEVKYALEKLHKFVVQSPTNPPIAELTVSIGGFTYHYSISFELLKSLYGVLEERRVELEDKLTRM